MHSVTLMIGLAVVPHFGFLAEPGATAAAQPPASDAPTLEQEAGADPFVQQWIPQFRKLLAAELNFVGTTCKPTPEQYKTIRAAGEVQLRLAVKGFADTQKKLQQGGFQVGQLPQWPDPRKIIADGLAKSVKETLPADQARRYEIELEKRAAARKRTAVINLVAKLDRDFVLTTAQRKRLTDVIDANWKESWVTQLEIFLNDEQFFPTLPDDLVLPILNEKQKAIWKGKPKRNHVFWGWFGMGLVDVVEMELEPAMIVSDPKEKAVSQEERP